MLLAWCQIVARSRMRANKLGIPKNLVFTAIPEFQGFGFHCSLPSTSTMFFSFQNFPNGKKILTVSCFTSQSFSELLEICGLSKIVVGGDKPIPLIGTVLEYLGGPALDRGFYPRAWYPKLPEITSLFVYPTRKCPWNSDTNPTQPPNVTREVIRYENFMVIIPV